MSKLISVIIPCYNQAPFLKETCLSIINQSYSNWEAIIINDGSTDNSKKIAQEICITDDRFKLITQKNSGLSAARNTGLKNATGEYIQFLDGDDKITPEKFSDAIDQFNNINVDIVISNFLRFKSKNGKIKKAFCDLSKVEYTFENILYQWSINFSIPIHCAILKRTIVNNTKFNTILKAKEDWKFWLDIYSKTPKTVFINKNAALYRIHQKSMTQNHSFMQENKVKANELIYQELQNNEHKTLFFKRINNELNNSNILVLKLKYQTGLKKFFYKYFS